MKKFILYTVVFLFIFFLSILLTARINSFIVKKRNFKNYETESNLLIFNKNQKYDIMFMGISHARNFSRHKNHLRVEKILNKNVINIGQGGGACGANEQLFYLDYYYKEGNSVNTIVYVLSPPMMFLKSLNQASNTFDYEPFEFTFFFNYLFFKTNNKAERLNSYIKSKFSSSWLKYQPKSLESKDKKLKSLDTAAVRKGFEFTFKNGLDTNVFLNSCVAVERTIKLAQENNTKVVFFVPPALFGKWYGHKETVEFAGKMKKKYNIDFYDYSESVLEPKYYYDHHHFNSNGIVYFTKNFLKPIL